MAFATWFSIYIGIRQKVYPISVLYLMELYPAEYTISVFSVYMGIHKKYTLHMSSTIWEYIKSIHER